MPRNHTWPASSGHRSRSDRAGAPNKRRRRAAPVTGKGRILSKFLTYWSLTIAIVIIWGFSLAVAFADVKDEMLTKLRKQVARARLRPVNPLAGRSVAETLAPPAMDEKERWVFHLVSAAAISLKLSVGILVLQDSMGHYLVHFTQGKRLVTYRVDKAWVADAMAGKADQRERISTAVDQYLRQEFLGQPIAPKAAVPAKPAPAAPPAASAAKPGAAPASTTPAATGGPAAATPATPAAPGTSSAPAAPAAAGEMSREERIAAARAKAEAMRAQRTAVGQPPSPPAPPPKDPEKS